MVLNDIIAKNLKKLRTDRNLSLGQLSDLCSVSKVMLSQIEKGETNPTINTIWKIANGLKVPYTKLIDEAPNNAVIVRKSECTEQMNEAANYRVFCYFKSSPTRNFEMFRVELDPHSSNESIGHSEKSQEYIYVTSGELILNTKGKEYILLEGDSIYFDSSVHHTYSNQQDYLLTFVVINYYP
ncbi:helix-turn-helix domain-containing protein [Metabacillus sp. RGM 3146]|uniref:helix-turn-helix domain-containing protein n=1 Tax=Metabacillus sp. RGM 3146 TaxID=3401092 RepID=UPI003B9A0118